MSELWKVILEVSTLLGGLSAVVFFFDRFRRRARTSLHRESLLPSPSSTVASVPKWLWTAGATALCLASCIALGIIGFKFGFFTYAGSSMALLAVTFLVSYISRTRNVGVFFWYAGWSASLAGMWAGILAVVFNFIVRGNIDFYAGTPLSVFTAVVCIALGMFSCYGFFRLEWFGEPWD